MCHLIFYKAYLFLHFGCIYSREVKKKLIKDDILRLTNDFTVRFNKSGVTGQDKLYFSVLKEHRLIQIPIDDEYWGGEIITICRIFYVGT